MSRVTVAVNGLSLVHEDSGGTSTATLPDVCLTPGAGAVPYSNVAHSRDLQGGTSVVRADGGRSIAVAGSSFARTYGDEAGTSGGVGSGVTGGEATWLSHSLDVAIEGRGACRLTDKLLHNAGNTIDCGGWNQPGAGHGPRAGAHGLGKGSAVDDTHVKLPPVPRFGIDTNLGDPRPSGKPRRLDTKYARSRGVSFVGRYLSVDQYKHPALTRREIDHLKHGGLDIFAIWEVGKRRSFNQGNTHDEYRAGVGDARKADQRLRDIGAPDKMVYFTVDEGIHPGFWHAKATTGDTTEHARNGDLILKYFEGVVSVVGKERAGAYGTFTTLRMLFKAGLITYGWQWTFKQQVDWATHHPIEARAQLHQYSIYAHQKPQWGVSGAGALDLDRAVKRDFGQW